MQRKGLEGRRRKPMPRLACEFWIALVRRRHPEVPLPVEEEEEEGEGEGEASRREDLRALSPQ
jgi:hypothetical protein